MKLLLIAFLASSLLAQSEPKALTNRDVLTLAKAGFTEEFIIETIAAQKSAFDTSASSLADLAKEGLNERVLRAMTGVKSAPQPDVPIAEKTTCAPTVKATRAGLAIVTQTPYYESTSLLFGLFHKKTRVGVVPNPDRTIAPRSAPRYVAIP